MSAPDRRPAPRRVRPGPPRRPATAGDTLFGLGIAGLGLVLAGAVFATGGGPAWLARLTGGEPTVTPAPSVAPSSAPTPSGPPAPSLAPTPTPTPPATPTAAPTPTPVAGPYTMNLYRAGVFVHQADKEWCVAAAALGMLNVIRLTEEGRAPDTSEATQRALYDRIVELTTWEDSHNGGTGPGGWAALLTEEGYPYELRVYDTRAQALRAAAIALRETNRPVGVLAWAGVHSWVLTGFTTTADPATTTDFSMTTARILDPWYPWVSNRWPRSEKPNAPRDIADLRANIRPWKLGSGPYEGRDGRFLLVVPLAP